MATQTAPIHSLADAETIAFLGEVLAIRISAEQSDGAVGVIEHIAPRGFATPLHVHPREAELFRMLEGGISIWLDGEVTSAVAGDVVWLPRGVEHALRVDSERAHLLALSLPGGHERFFRLAGEPVAAFDLDAVGAQPPDIERMTAAAAAAGVEILGPPPFDEEQPATQRSNP